MWLLSAKAFIETVSALPQPALHLFIGSFIFWIVFIATLSLFVLFRIEIINEANDILILYIDDLHYSDWRDSMEDFAWTMATPLMIAFFIAIRKNSRKKKFVGRVRVIKFG